MVNQNRVNLMPSAAGYTPDQRATRDASLVVANGGADYEEMALQNQLFTAATASAALAVVNSTAPTFTLYNPIGSGVNLVVMRVAAMLTAAPGAATVISLNTAIQLGPVVTFTLNTAVSGFIGSSVGPKGQCFATATLITAPVIRKIIGGVVAVGSVTPGIFDVDLNGALCLGPGVAMTLGASAAASVAASITWKEVAV